MLDTLSTSDVMTADAVLADEAAPAELRVALRGALDAYERARLVRQDHRTRLAAARETAQHAPGLAAAEVRMALDSGEDLDIVAIGAGIHTARTTVDQLEAGMAVVHVALRQLVERVRTGCYRDHRAEVVRWVTEVRAGTSWWDPVPAHVVHAWSVVGTMTVVYPHDACTVLRADGTVVNLAARERLPLTGGERVAWMWSQLAAGEVRWNGPGEVRPTGWWDGRAPLPPRPSAATPPARRRPLFARA